MSSFYIFLCIGHFGGVRPWTKRNTFSQRQLIHWFWGPPFSILCAPPLGVSDQETQPMRPCWEVNIQHHLFALCVILSLGLFLELYCTFFMHCRTLRCLLTWNSPETLSFSIVDQCYAHKSQLLYVLQAKLCLLTDTNKLKFKCEYSMFYVVTYTQHKSLLTWENTVVGELQINVQFLSGLSFRSQHADLLCLIWFMFCALGQQQGTDWFYSCCCFVVEACIGSNSLTQSTSYGRLRPSNTQWH